MSLARRAYHKLRGIEPNPHRKVSYSQSGEDLIIDYVLGWMGSPTRTYLDIGAHHPTFLSNTYLFYEQGHRGVSIEPDPVLHAVIEKRRPGDTNLNIGIGSDAQEEAEFYIMNPTTLNTFSKKEAETYVKHYPGTTIDRVVKLPLVGINTMLKKHFHETAPDFVSLDVEGLDFEIIQSFDFDTHRPKVFCIETAEYASRTSLKKAIELMQFVKSKDYFLYADTFTNSIFVDGSSKNASKLPQITPLGIS